MPKPNPERRYSYENKTPGEYRDGDHVMVTMSNGCRAKGIVKIDRGNGMISSMKDQETGEIVYKVEIKDGPLRGAPYSARESQLEHGWSADVAGQTCEDDSAVRQPVTASAPQGSEAGGHDVETAALVAGGLILVAMAGFAASRMFSGRRPGFAS